MKGHILIIFVIIILSYYFSLFLEPYMTLTSSSIPKTIDSYIYISNSIINGEGAFASRDVKKNVILFEAIDKNRNVTYLGSKVNHCKICNTQLVKINSQYYIVSKKEILKDEELTVDYDDTPKFIKKSKKEWVC